MCSHWDATVCLNDGRVVCGCALQSYGPLVHSLARLNKIQDAFAVLREMRDKGLTCPEHHVALLRKRCKEIGIWDDAIPAHPLAWQFTPQARLLKKAQGKRTRRMQQYIRAVTG